MFFLITWETRLKRRRALDAVHELRALAHIIDMHQLTKDPELVCQPQPADDRSSPPRDMTRLRARPLPRLLQRDALDRVSKIGGALRAELPRRHALAAVDEVESLTTGLSRKIWQKIMILDRE